MPGEICTPRDSLYLMTNSYGTPLASCGANILVPLMLQVRSGRTWTSTKTTSLFRLFSFAGWLTPSLKVFSRTLLQLISCYCSVAQSCLTLLDSMEYSMPGFSVPHHFLEIAQVHVHWIGDAIHSLIVCHPLLFLPSVLLSIRVFSSESAVHIRWLKYWSFSFSISPSNEYSGMISFKIEWFDLLAFQGTLKSLL